MARDNLFVELLTVDDLEVSVSGDFLERMVVETVTQNILKWKEMVRVPTLYTLDEPFPGLATLITRDK